MTINIISVKPSFVDIRGVITNVLDEQINSVVLITCNQGAVRANHYHKEDSHWSYIISGKMEYSEKTKSGTVETVVVKEGEMVFSAPSVPHAMKFLEPSAFLALTTRKRLGGRYDEDTVRCTII